MNFSKIFLLCIFLSYQALTLDNAALRQIDPNLLKQYEKMYKTEVSSQPTKLSKLLKDSIENKNPSPDSSLIVKDTSSGIKKTFLSTYEQLILGINLDPDTILNNLAIYGYDVFKNSKPTTFAPNDNTAVPADYLINADDEILIMLWGRINEEYRVKVSRDGSINIPRIGPVQVAGLPFETMKKNILDRVGKIEGVSASISMGALRSIGVYIVGEVISPGYYTVSALSNVTNALFAAGGPLKSGSLRNVQLKRNGRQVAHFDFYDFLMSGQDRSGYRLQSGDVIHVPVVKSMAAIVGNVRRSALYEISDNTSLENLISLAGGLTPSAWTNKIQIERYDLNLHRVVIDLDSCKDKIPDFLIKDGDIVKILPILSKDKNAVYLNGNVLRPGKYQFKDNMRIRDVIQDYNSILPETFFDYAVIYRSEAPNFSQNIITFNLKTALDNNTSPDNIELKPQDQIMVYNRDFFEPDRFINIDGAVTSPGRYKLLENMKIRDVVLLAGGLKDEASLIKGELYRRKSSTMEKVSVDKIDFCVECAMKDSLFDNIKLQKSDHIFIRNKMGWEEERKVTLKGQVTYPGTYILYEGETLGDLIKRAGGFKDDAFLAAAVFTRMSVKDFEIKRIDDYSRQLETDILKLSAEIAAKENPLEAKEILAQQMALKEKLKSAEVSGRIVIDLREEANYKDFSLEDKDEIFIPRKLNTVSVIGEVYNPATFKFSKNDVFYFINAAGGFKETSDKKHIYIIKANGTIINNKTTRVLSAMIEPGDAVVVPQKIRYTNGHKIFVDTADAIFKIATLLATLATLMVTASTLSK